MVRAVLKPGGRFYARTTPCFVASIPPHGMCWLRQRSSLRNGYTRAKKATDSRTEAFSDYVPAIAMESVRIGKMGRCYQYALAEKLEREYTPPKCSAPRVVDPLSTPSIGNNLVRWQVMTQAPRAGHVKPGECPAH